MMFLAKYDDEPGIQGWYADADDTKADFNTAPECGVRNGPYIDLD